jgi:chromosome segregation ATPase
MDDLEWLNQFKAEYRRRYPKAVANSYLDAIGEKLSKLSSDREVYEMSIKAAEAAQHTLWGRITELESRLADLELQATSRDEQNADLQSRLDSEQSKVGELTAMSAYRLLQIKDLRATLENVIGLIHPWATHCDYRAEKPIQAACGLINAALTPSVVERQNPEK